MNHKLIMENWRRFVNEEALEEAALGMGSGGLSELGGMTFRIEPDGEWDGYYAIKALSEDGAEMGYVDLDDEALSVCDFYSTHSFIEDAATGNFGTFLYNYQKKIPIMAGRGCVVN